MKGKVSRRIRLSAEKAVICLPLLLFIIVITTFGLIDTMRTNRYSIICQEMGYEGAIRTDDSGFSCYVSCPVESAMLGECVLVQR